ncbi:phage portal protein [Alicyclobacillus fastidiosus]|uniref:Phage portal protein n=1 Tax=Alicyclobacillus fastidiosus TaxID=392011 RepID=A0ABV5ALD3_9BACL|nr:phage portal protein [Alicyclobacillus fastidiosus]WEH08486.1 phage portal protein [Alicyclobacillus fastidiosus]
MGVEIFGKMVSGNVLKRSNMEAGLNVLSSALTSLQAQLQANQSPDKTLGTPFASQQPNADWSTVAQMGPGNPATPFPLGGEPRQWVYRVGWNFPTPPDSDRRIDGQLLRRLADMTFLIRRAIEIRKTEICALDWDIVPSQDALQDPKYGNTQRERGKTIAKKYGDMTREIRQFFQYPEGYYTTYDAKNWIRKGEISWKDWLNAVIEDYYVGDWLTIWPQKTLGGKLVALRRVDGENTKVLLSLDGRLPAPPLPAYQIYAYGVPRASFTQDELYFWPRNLRNITPYGFSHVEQCMILMLLLLRYDQFNIAMYNDSTLPLGILEAPENQSPQQIQDIADFLNGAVSTVADKMRVYPAPAGTKWQAIKPFEFDVTFANYVIDLACVAMDVTRQEMGFAPSNSNGLGGSGHAQAMEDLEKRKGLIPLAKWIEEKMTRIIRDHWGTTDIEFKFTELITEDLNEKYEANDKALRSGQISLDQVLEELGGEGIGWGHMIETHAGVILPEQQLLITSQGVLPLTPQQQATGGFPPTGDPQTDAQNAGIVEAIKQHLSSKAASPTSDDDERKKREEEMTAGWLALLRKKKNAIKNESFVTSAQVRRAFYFSDDDVTELAEIIAQHRLEAYQDAYNELPQTDWVDGEPDWSEIILGEVQKAAEHARMIADTWNSDLNESAVRIEATGADVDELVKQLTEWMDDRADWKGQQIAITEVTDAESDAGSDWSSHHQTNGIGYMKWVAKMDHKTCRGCRELHGRVVDPEVIKPPRHPNCRCQLVPIGTPIRFERR